MSWLQRLKQFSGLATSPRSDIAPLLTDLNIATALLAHAAKLAPTPTAQADLRPVVAKAESAVQQVRDLFHDYGTLQHQSATNGIDTAGGRNHWARLFAALEQHRKVRQALRVLAISPEEADPQLSAGLARIARDEETVVEHLRNLIALADPQALD